MLLTKIRLLFTSRRFMAAVIGSLLVALQEYLPITDDQVQQFTAIIIGWIIGDSLLKTGIPIGIGTDTSKPEA